MGRMITLQQAASVINVSPGTLYYWRKKRNAQRPPEYKVGSLVMYDRDELEEWLQSRKCKV